MLFAKVEAFLWCSAAFSAVGYVVLLRWARVLERRDVRERKARLRSFASLAVLGVRVRSHEDKKSAPTAATAGARKLGA